MTSSVESVPLVGVTNSEFPIDSHAFVHKKYQCRHALKSKENTYKHKCNKVLRRKLKKYKLRQDGREDQDVLDVSKILVSSLIIKSPSSSKVPINLEGELREFDELRPKNYLFKMVRRRNGNKITEYLGNPKVEKEIEEDDENTSTPTVSQEKKQTNAFKLLMDSRNKSIGSNSPGKEKSVDESEDEEFLEKKNVKVKRHLLLQKMAEAKGSLKKKEMEEYQEEFIKRKMEKRAEKLKSMILIDKKVVKKDKLGMKSKEVSIPVSTSIGDNKANDIVKKKKKTLQIVDIFNAIEETVTKTPGEKNVSKEDNEFLKKLSPSIKKKESMLSYFKKLDKEPECPVDSENNSPIKVKLTKTKKRGRKKKLSLNKNLTGDNDMSESMDKNNDIENVVTLGIPNTLNEQHIDKKVNCESQKQRNIKVNDDNTDAKPAVTSEDRPRRSVKRPIKYNDDAYLSSSDEELHIFTPKKKKQLREEHTENMLIAEEKSSKVKLKKTITDPVKPKEKKVVKEKCEPKQPVKLAPIFSKSSQTDPAVLEAKQKFLQSGVPDKLKKIINQQKVNNILATNFSVVVHVQQNDVTNLVANQKSYNIPIKVVPSEEENIMYYTENAFKKMLYLCEEDNPVKLDFNCKPSIQALLQNIKELHPKFPVYRTYRYLKGKRKGEFKDFNYTDFDNSIEIMNGVVDITHDSTEMLNWTYKYKALTTNQIIGNFESTKELRKWLVSWTENELRSKSKPTLDSDSSDYYQSDTDSKDSAKSMNNLIILTGPTGSGKTSCVYAVAAELAMKVIEVNVSSKRTGKIMLQELQEATKSHKVNRGTGASDNSQKSEEKSDITKSLISKRGRPKKIKGENVKKSTSTKSDFSGTPSSQESVRTGMSLILIDDADIVFEQDDGFSSAIVQLVQSSKRPVILVTSSLVCPHLQRFMQYGKILIMSPLLPRMLGTWLDIMCLADTNICWPGLGAKFLNYFNGDIRKTINYLQFYTSPYVTNLDEEAASQNIDNFKVNIDDENSSMSWGDHGNGGIKFAGENNNIDMDTTVIWYEFFDKQSNLLTYKHPAEIFNIWWSVPHLLDLASTSEHKTDSIASKKTESTMENTSGTGLEAIANAVDALSLADFYCHRSLDPNRDITSDPWFSSAADSVSEQENLDLYFRSHDLGADISHELVTGSISRAQSVLCCSKRTNLEFPDMALQRQRDKTVSRHNNLTSYLNSWSVLDRRAVALDYWPSCRSICRIEKDKTDNNSKRNNRFCHYLKSLSVLCKSDTFDKLGYSLSSNNVSENN